MTADEACEELGISAGTFYATKKKLGIVGYGVGRKAKYRLEDIERMSRMERPLKATGRRKKIEAKEVTVM